MSEENIFECFHYIFVTSLEKIKNAGKMEQKAMSQSHPQVRQEFPGNIEFEMKMPKIENPVSTSMSLSGN